MSRRPRYIFEDLGDGVTVARRADGRPWGEMGAVDTLRALWWLLRAAWKLIFGPGKGVSG